MTSATLNLRLRRAQRPNRSPWASLVSRTWRQTRTKIGLGIVAVLVLIAIVGPAFAPYAPDEPIKTSTHFAHPFEGPSSSALLGTDNLARDVLSRFLWGGRSVLALSLLATSIGIALGTAVGLAAAYWRGVADEVLMRGTDVVIALPQLVLGLVAVATVGPKVWVIVLAVAIGTAPRVARVIRGAAGEVVERDFVRMAEALGQSRTKIVVGEVLPNVVGPLVVECALRFTYAIAMIAALSFIGFGLQPPAADWGLMINENRQGLAIEPWGVVAPVLALALLTIGTSLIGDGLARAAAGIERGEGRSA